MKGTNNQYIFRLSSSDIINVFLDFSNNICISYLKNRLVWSLPKIIIENAAPPFAACIATDDTIHIFSPLVNGNLRHTTFTPEKTYSTPILFSKNNPIQCNGINCCFYNDKIHLVYSLLYENKYILTYQSIDKATISSPEALGLCDSDNPCLNIMSDKNSNLHILFINNLNMPEHIQMSSNGQKNRIPIYPENSDSISTSYYMDCIIDNNTLHLCILTSSLLYLKKSELSPLWDNPIKVYNIENYKNTSAHIIIKNSDLVINWFNENKPVYTASHNSGLSWSPPSAINLKRSNTQASEYYPNNIYNRNSYFPYLLIHYKSNAGDKTNLICNTIPGILYNDFRLAFYEDDIPKTNHYTNNTQSDYGSSISTRSANSLSGNNHNVNSYKNNSIPIKKDNLQESFKNIFMDTLSTLKESVENTSELCNENRKAIARLERQMLELEKEVIALIKKN